MHSLQRAWVVDVDEPQPDPSRPVAVQFDWVYQGRARHPATAGCHWLPPLNVAASPRLAEGTEVVVSFTEGDPDRPLITGFLHGPASVEADEVHDPATPVLEDCPLDGVQQWLCSGEAPDVAVPAARWWQFQSLRPGALHLSHGNAPWPERCGMSAVQAAGANPQWLLLDMPGAPQVGVTLQETFAHARWFWLFEDTEWQALQEQGPVLIDLQSCPALADLCRVDVTALAWAADVQRGDGVDTAGASAAHAQRLVPTCITAPC